MPRKMALTTRTLPERSARGILSHGLCVVGGREKVWWVGPVVQRPAACVWCGVVASVEGRSWGRRGEVREVD
jgi:hypothetical protein